MENLWESVIRSFIPFVANLGLLSLLAWGLSLRAKMIWIGKGEIVSWDAISVGCLLGVISCILMFLPIEFVPGLFVDTRGVPIIFSSILAGPVAGVITTLAAAFMRYSIGGVGMPGGVIYVFVFGASGIIVWFLMRNTERLIPQLRYLVLQAIITTAFTMPVIFLLPEDKRFGALITLWPYLFLANIVGMLVLGALIKLEEARRQTSIELERLNDKLENTNNDLEAVVQERTARLASMNAELHTRLTQLEEQLKAAETKRFDLVSEISSSSLKSADMAQQNAKLTQRLRENDEELEVLRSQIQYFTRMLYQGSVGDSQELS